MWIFFYNLKQYSRAKSLNNTKKKHLWKKNYDSQTGAVTNRAAARCLFFLSCSAKGSTAQPQGRETIGRHKQARRTLRGLPHKTSMMSSVTSKTRNMAQDPAANHQNSSLENKLWAQSNRPRNEILFAIKNIPTSSKYNTFNFLGISHDRVLTSLSHRVNSFWHNFGIMNETQQICTCTLMACNYILRMLQSLVGAKAAAKGHFVWHLRGFLMIPISWAQYLSRMLKLRRFTLRIQKAVRGCGGH